ncbi:MAG: hypothetical protein M1816_000439 [Peltula sp. TS41687]|nr:MAG: hypothetical protein M1816_000439 [Peltula sp. TS41687]
MQAPGEVADQQTRKREPNHHDLEQPKQLPSPSASRTPPEAGDSRKRKAAPLSEQAQDPCEPPQKRHQTSNTASIVSDRISHWVRYSQWPKEELKPSEMPPSKRSRSTSQSRESDNVTLTPSDQKARDQKSSPYAHARYKTLLETKNSFMKDSETGLKATERDLCNRLLTSRRAIPSNTLFEDEFFIQTLDKIQSQNETRVVRDIALLITPSAEILTTRGAKQLQHLAESTNAGWNSSIPFEGPRPQPDFSVGYRSSAFSEEQRKKLDLQATEKSYYTATEDIYFPFFTTEVKCGNQALDIADRQNAHSMTVAVRGVFELYRAIDRQEELHGQVLAFSISHDHRNVRIYAHYPEVEGAEVKYYRHLIKGFDILSEDGKERWVASTFTRNVYDDFMSVHLERIKSAIDDLPVPNLASFMRLDEIPGLQDTSEPMSQDTDGFLKPAQVKGGKGVTARLTQQIELLTKTSEKEREEARLEKQQLMRFLEKVEQEREKEREEARLEKQKVEQEREKEREEARLEKQQLMRFLEKVEQEREKEREEAKLEKQQLMRFTEKME